MQSPLKSLQWLKRAGKTIDWLDLLFIAFVWLETQPLYRHRWMIKYASGHRDKDDRDEKKKKIKWNCGSIVYRNGSLILSHFHNDIERMKRGEKKNHTPILNINHNGRGHIGVLLNCVTFFHSLILNSLRIRFSFVWQSIQLFVTHTHTTTITTNK